MKALVYLGSKEKALQERPKPGVTAPTDAIVKMTLTTICGTDLHILKGDVATCEPGRILGHEGVGVVEEVGAAVTAFKPGDRVLISCITACGKCDYCRRLMYSHCVNGGWILGNKIDGTQAEFVRIPYAETSLYPIPDGADEEALVMLSDILPTGFECGVLNGKVQPGVDRGDRRLGADRARRPADGSVLLAGRDHHDRSRRQSPGSRQALRRDGEHQQQRRQGGGEGHGDDRQPRRRHRHRGGGHSRRPSNSANRSSRRAA